MAMSVDGYVHAKIHHLSSTGLSDLNNHLAASGDCLISSYNQDAHQ